MSLQNIYPIETLVFIAGVSMPHDRVVVNSAFNTVPTATVALPPDHRLFGIGRFDRVPIQIFVKNHFAPKGQPGGLDNDPESPEDYLLIFEGDVATFGYSSTKISREFVINAHGVLAFLRDVQINFLTNVTEVFSSGARSQALAGLNNTYFGPMLPTFLLSRGLQGSGGNANESIQHPYELLQNAYEFITNPSSVGNDKSTNAPIFGKSTLAEFYAFYGNLVRLRDRFIKVPYFDESLAWDSNSGAINAFPILSLVQSAVSMALINKKFEDTPNSNSIYDILSFLVSYMEFELCFLNSPTMRNGKISSSLMKPILYDAHPPKCNIIYPAHCGSIGTEENVYAVPTRIRTYSQYHPLSKLADSSSPAARAVSELIMYNVFPAPNDYLQSKKDNDLVDIFHQGLLPTESFTGPYVYDAAAPIWMHLLTKKDAQGAVDVEGAKKYQEQTLRTMLMLKQNEYRTLSVESAFNLNFTPGFPGVVYDNIDTNLSFCGQVIAVSHILSKGSATTTVEMGFVRTLKEQLERPLKNSFLPIYENVTSDAGKMNAVYSQILGCGSVSYEDCYNTREDVKDIPPSEAYTRNFRDIVTLPQYLQFMGGNVATWVENTTEPDTLSSAYMTERMDLSLIEDPFAYGDINRPSSDRLQNLLVTIAQEYTGNSDNPDGTKIYMRDFA